LNLDLPNLPRVVGSELPPAMMPAAEEDLSNPGMSIAQAIGIVRAHLRHSLIAFCSLALASGVLIKFLPHSYVATATLIVNHSDNNPLATPVFPGGLEATFIPTQIELIQSAAVLQPVIDQLHLMSDPEWRDGFRGPDAALRESVLTKLTTALTVAPGAGSDLLYISASAKHADEAARIANAVTDQYLKLSRERIDQPAVQSAELYSKELEDLRQKTIEAQDKVTAFRQKSGMIDLAPGNGDEANTTLTDLDQRLLAAENQERSVQAQLQAQAWGIVSAAAPGNADLAGNLATEQTELAKLRQTLGPQHPQVLELESQIAATQKAIAASLSSQLADSRKLVAQYSAAVDAQRQLVLNRRHVQDSGAKLVLELESAEATYKRALDGYSEIKFASTDKTNDVSMVSPAVPPVKAEKPNKGKLFFIACFLSLGLAFGIPFIYELLVDRRLRCRDDLERHFGIAVLGQFGSTQTGEARA
jgi:succinoglycan biosynthesis transport protein ExoP